LNARAAAENFPVAGWFMAARHRPLVRVYYTFARTADDIADATDKTIIQKLSALDALDHALQKGTGSAEDPGHEMARHLGAMLRDKNLPMSLATDLLTAFRADARNTIIRTFADVMAYCANSAAPVGRFLLAIHDEPQSHEASDALCAALQVLNHVQDARNDALELRRCYIPMAWLNAQNIDLVDLHNFMGHTVYQPGFIPLRDDYNIEGGEDAVDLKPHPLDDSKMRICLNMMLDECEKLLVLAVPLPTALRDRGLAAQSAAILTLAKRLLKRLRANNPWQRRIKLRAVDWLAAMLSGAKVWLTKT
jgi:hydroxysqualene synthase